MKNFFKIFFYSYSFCIAPSAFAQNPLVKIWDYRFGGSIEEELFTLSKTDDGGFLLGGWSRSPMDGDVSEPNRDSTCYSMDFWFVKTNKSGQKELDKRFGGSYQDWGVTAHQTFDKGYILGGWSNSDSSGDKSQSPAGGSGDWDYWLVKCDSVGNKIWDKDFGSFSQDLFNTVIECNDHGFICGGTANSGISGDKTDAGYMSPDFWIIKTDSLGNKMWDKAYGGTSTDFLSVIIQTNDRGFLFGGTSRSRIGGIKTEDCWDTTNAVFPASDYWIVKTDSNGTYQWDKRYGGYSDDDLYTISQCIDGGYILGGLSASDSGGDKTQNTRGLNDYWIVKIDSSGIKQWDKDFGGTDNESMFGSVIQTSDSGFLTSGLSLSDMGGDKSENNLAQQQTWAVKTDSLGNKLWDKTMLVNGKVERGFCVETDDHCFAFADFNDGTIAGDKSQDAWAGTIDYWIIKLCDSIQLPPTAAVVAPSSICPGTCTSFLNLSQYASTYIWSFPGASPNTSTDINPSNICYSTPGSYDVTLIASNANGSDTLILQNYITVYPQPSSQSIFQSNDTLFAVAGASFYQWYFNGNVINGATDYFYVAIANGDYNVVATDSNGCEVEAVINDVLTGFSPALSQGEGITAFPNPVTETLYIRGLENNTADQIKIFNVYGEKVFEAVHCKLLPIAIGTNCQFFPAGLYYIEISADKKIYRTKFVKS